MKNLRRGLFAALVLASAGMLGCEGAVNIFGTGGEKFAVSSPGLPGSSSEGGQSEPGSSDEVGDAPPGTIPREDGREDVMEEEVCRFIDPGATPLRRLTENEYNRTVRDLFPGVTIERITIGADEHVSGFAANVVAPVTPLQAEAYQSAAETIAQAAFEQNFDGLVACGEMAEDECAANFIENFGARAYRRPLDQTERDALYALYELGKTEFDFQTGLQMVVEGLLQSPHFLYRVEQGEQGDEPVVALTDYEIASRLSYFLWGSMPDEELMQAAAAGELQDPAKVEEQARRMIEDPKARDRINDVIASWLEVDKVITIDKDIEEFTPELRESMLAETRTFIDHVIWEADGRIGTLLGADYTFVDQRLAELYGVEAPQAGEGFVRVQLPPNRRGLLTHAGILSAHGFGQIPVHRGYFIREAFICSPPGAPPDDLDQLPTQPDDSMRERAEQRMNAREEGCAGCHALMDPIGLVFDNFDEMGRYQTEDEHGNPLTAEGGILGTRETNGQVNGVSEFVDLLDGSPEVEACVSKQWFRYAFARQEGQSDGCSMHMMNEALARSNGDIKQLLVAIATTDAFLYRRNIELEQ